MNKLYNEHPVMFRNNPILFLISIILIPFIVGIIILVYWYFKNLSSTLQITNDHILYEEGLLSKDRSELKIISVRSVKVKQTFFNRIFNTGNIEIYTSGDNPEIIAKGMPNPNFVRELISNKSN